MSHDDMMTALHEVKAAKLDPSHEFMAHMLLTMKQFLLSTSGANLVEMSTQDIVTAVKSGA
jgi:hypothetical protein